MFKNGKHSVIIVKLCKCTLDFKLKVGKESDG